MAAFSLRSFLQSNNLDPAAGISHLIPSAAGGCVNYLGANTGSLEANQQLNVYGELVSNSRLFNLILQSDGNLVLYRTQFCLPLWASNTQGMPVDHVAMQGDGNLVAYSAGGVSLWATNTEGHPGSSLQLQDDGNLVVYDNGGHPLWASNTVQTLLSPTCQYTEATGYQYDETSENWKQLCTAFPCFAALHWPGYDTNVIDTTPEGQPLIIEGQPVVVQLWKGTCQNFSITPGGVGGEVGIYHRIPGRARPTLKELSFLPKVLAAFIIAAIAPLTDNDLWWAFPELMTKVAFTFTNPVTNQTFFSRGPEITYWCNKWMESKSYNQYENDQGGQVPGATTDYLLNYTINGVAFPQW
jgi:hypothetical protein